MRGERRGKPRRGDITRRGPTANSITKVRAGAATKIVSAAEEATAWSSLGSVTSACSVGETERGCRAERCEKDRGKHLCDEDGRAAGPVVEERGGELPEGCNQVE